MGADDLRLAGDPRSPKFGLPVSLRVPIAAATIEAISVYVGEVVGQRASRDGTVKAVLVAALRPPPEPAVRLWTSELASVAMDRLHPANQVWVDVDYAGYRQAYLSFGLTIPTGYFLDHVQNRKAIRLRDRSHPWLRLGPVKRAVNTSGGSPEGGEGMEKQYLAAGRPRGRPLPEYDIVYADPMDLTKMLDIEPGLWTLDGVRDTEALFYS